MPKDINTAGTGIIFEKQLDLSQVRKYSLFLMKIFIFQPSVQTENSEAVSLHIERLLIASYVRDRDVLNNSGLHVRWPDPATFHWKLESIRFLDIEQLVRFQKVQRSLDCPYRPLRIDWRRGHGLQSVDMRMVFRLETVAFNSNWSSKFAGVVLIKARPSTVVQFLSSTRRL